MKISPTKHPQLAFLPATILALSIHCATSSALANQEETQSAQVVIADDGPYVFWRDAETAVLLSYCDGKVIETVIENITEPLDVAPPCSALTTIRLDPTPPAPTSTTWEMPKRVLAISDLEGNYETLVQFLKANKVVDKEHAYPSRYQVCLFVYLAQYFCT